MARLTEDAGLATRMAEAEAAVARGDARPGAAAAEVLAALGQDG